MASSIVVRAYGGTVEWTREYLPLDDDTAGARAALINLHAMQGGTVCVGIDRSIIISTLKA